MIAKQHMMRMLKAGFFSLLLLLLAPAAKAQTREYQVKALFLYNFGQFVDWPAGALAGNTPFVIGVVGNDPFGRFLDDVVREEQFEGRPIVVQHYEHPSEIRSCHILFVGSHVRESLAAVAGRPVLTVGEGGDFIEAGGMIQFFTEQNRIRFLIRPSAAKAVKLTISSKLLRLAKITD
ncbi:MAG: YfiR family protein [Chitinophagaceae bacterium]|nr:MAG: YfiR family protein [Chitinophagaceae bacterium]